MLRAGDRIRARRKERSVSVSELADHLGVSRSTIYRYEKGDIEKLPAEHLEKIARYLDTTPSALMGWPAAATPDRATGPGEQMAELMARLNDLGQAEAVKQVENLTYNPRYQRQAAARPVRLEPTAVLAAHNDTTDPEEQALMREDIAALLQDD